MCKILTVAFQKSSLTAGTVNANKLTCSRVSRLHGEIKDKRRRWFGDPGSENVCLRCPSRPRWRYPAWSRLRYGQSYVSVPRSRHCSSGRDRSDEEALFRESDARRSLVDSTQDSPLADVISCF